MKPEPCKHDYVCVETAAGRPGSGPFVHLILTARCRQCLALLPFGAVDIRDGVIHATADRAKAEAKR